MSRRFEAYKTSVVRPFFRDHFSKIDRQVVLVDVLSALHNGPDAVDDLRETMRDVLSAFRPGKNTVLSRLIGRTRVEKVLFAATKVDHVHQAQHPAVTGIMNALTQDAASRAEFQGGTNPIVSFGKPPLHHRGGARSSGSKFELRTWNYAERSQASCGLCW